ncbi:hypothetical protein BDW22DRAFT_321393 [Trametopsis cervina]|nr:hypothetical protein BDW22DRAFT_321393 [Trametopsis cervina]
MRKPEHVPGHLSARLIQNAPMYGSLPHGDGRRFGILSIAHAKFQLYYGTPAPFPLAAKTRHISDRTRCHAREKCYRTPGSEVHENMTNLPSWKIEPRTSERLGEAWPDSDCRARLLRERYIGRATKRRERLFCSSFNPECHSCHENSLSSLISPV